MGVPYHWGGRCGWGFDCSGLTSLAAALVGIGVPRDASMQHERGLEVDLGQEQLDDVVFFSNDKGQITHVGITDGEGRVIHASGEVRIDVLKGDGLHRHETQVSSRRRHPSLDADAQLKTCVCFVPCPAVGTRGSLFSVTLPQRFQHVDEFRIPHSSFK